MEKKMGKRKIQSRRPALSCDLLHETATSRQCPSALVSQRFDKAASCSTLVALFFSFFVHNDVRSLTFFQRKQAKWLLPLHAQQLSVWERSYGVCRLHPVNSHLLASW